MKRQQKEQEQKEKGREAKGGEELEGEGTCNKLKTEAWGNVSNEQEGQMNKVVESKGG